MHDSQHYLDRQSVADVSRVSLAPSTVVVPAALAAYTASAFATPLVPVAVQNVAAAAFDNVAAAAFDNVAAIELEIVVAVAAYQRLKHLTYHAYALSFLQDSFRMRILMLELEVAIASASQVHYHYPVLEHLHSLQPPVGVGVGDAVENAGFEA